MLAVGKTKPAFGIDLFERPEPAINDPNDVLIEVGACGICGTDLHIYQWHEDSLSGPMEKMTFPRVLGHEVAGTVLEVGRGVAAFKAGDKVVNASSGGCGICYYCLAGLSNMCDTRITRLPGILEDGGFARYVTMPAFTLVKMPDDFSFEVAATAQPLTVALHAVERSYMGIGEHVVIMGPGPIGLMQVLLARANGAASIVIAGLQADRGRLQLAAQLGARPVDVTTQNLIEIVLDVTDGRGADVVFDCAGGSLALTQAMGVARRGAKIVVLGSGHPGEFDQNQIMQKELTILGSFARLKTTWIRAFNLLQSKVIDLSPIISKALPLQDAPAAFESLVKREAVKIVLTP